MTPQSARERPADTFGGSDLIEAAPALLAACKAAADYFAEKCDFGVLDKTPERDLWDRLLAAIARAEGQS